MNKSSRINIAEHRCMMGLSISRSLQSKRYGNFLLKTSSELDLSHKQDVANFFAFERPDYVFLAAVKVAGIVANNTFRAIFFMRT